MKRRIKNYLKTTWLWKKIAASDIYNRLRDPVTFKQQQVEPNFYKDLFNKAPSKNNLIFDVGANIGSKSKIFSKLAKKVVAFEPSERLCDILNKRFEGSNVIIHNLALGSIAKSSELFIIEKNEAYNSLNRKHIDVTATNRKIATIETVKRKEVRVEVIETFIQKYGAPKYIKIDVEGYEHEVIKGLKTLVQFLSFEANLPEFCEESVASINYLSSISSDRYIFNFTTDNYFLLEEFVTKSEAITFLRNTKLEYLEIYAKLT